MTFGMSHALMECVNEVKTRLGVDEATAVAHIADSHLADNPVRDLDIEPELVTEACDWLDDYAIRLVKERLGAVESHIRVRNSEDATAVNSDALVGTTQKVAPIAVCATTLPAAPTVANAPKWVYELAGKWEELNGASHLEAALQYARWGIPVFRLAKGTKVPFAGTNGKDDATTDLAVVEEWWTETPQANIGGLCGVEFSVLDVDTKKAVNGWVATGKLAKAGLLRGSWAQVQTPSRGRPETGFPHGSHFYFTAEGSGHGSGKFALDYKSVGGYVLLPPSVRTDGPENERGRYLWTGVAPDRYSDGFDWDTAMKVLTPPQPAVSRRPVAKSGSVKALIDEVTKAPEGSKHNILVWAACRVVDEGQDPEVLRDAALTAGHTTKQFEDAIRWAAEREVSK